MTAPASVPPVSGTTSNPFPDAASAPVGGSAVLTPDAWQDRIDAERHDAQQEQYERDHRERNVILGDVVFAVEELRFFADAARCWDPAIARRAATLRDRLTGTMEVLQGEWMRSPAAMAAARLLAMQTTNGGGD